MLRFHTQTGGSTRSPRRNPTITFGPRHAAGAGRVLGGTQSLHTNGKDEALALPTAQSAKLALRTQQIIAYESGVAGVVDPLAGSYYVESLTNDLIERADALIKEIDALGGSVAVVESGWMQARIAESAYAAQQAVERGDATVVGVNKFAEDASGDAIALQRVDEATGREQAERVRAFRTARDQHAADRALEDVRRAASGTENLMPYFIEAVDAGATLGEICGVLRDVFGVYRAHEVGGVAPMQIDHVAIIVEDLDTAVRLYGETLGFTEIYREIVADQGVETVGFCAGDAVIELLRPLQADSPIARYRGNAESRLHHTAFRVWTTFNGSSD